MCIFEVFMFIFGVHIINFHDNYTTNFSTLNYSLQLSFAYQKLLGLTLIRNDTFKPHDQRNQSLTF